MPYYDLRCIDCGAECNLKASMADKTDRRIPCPSCGSFHMETVFKSAPSYVKGTQEFACPNSHVCGAGCCLAQH